MRSLTALVSASAVVVGLGGGAAAYQLASAPVTPAPAQSGHTARPAARPAPGLLVRWAACRPPAVRQGNACVTEVVRTVVRPSSGEESGPGEESTAEDLFEDLGDDQAVDQTGEHADEQADDHGEDEADEESGDSADHHGEDSEEEVEHEDEPGD